MSEQEYKTIDAKLDGIMRAINAGFTDVYSMFEKVDSRLDELNSKVDENTRLINRSKLELIDKLASQKRVNDQEVRILQLESAIPLPNPVGSTVSE